MVTERITRRTRRRTTTSPASRYLVGGVNSPVRAFRHVQAEPLQLVGGQGAVVRDTAGRRYVDFIMGWGTLLLGHRPPAVVRALSRAMERDILLGLTHPAETELAQLICEAVPSVERVRFTVSGTEACMTAVRLARAATGRSKILTFDGCYHGHGDSLMAGTTAGIPEAWLADTLRVPFNDPRALDTTLRREGERLACVMIEPIPANTGVLVPEAGFLQRLRALTQEYGILLVFDEVVTGFRVGPGGAQGRYGIRPDLTTFGKIIGGGLPIGALGGSASLMQRLAPDGDVYHGGTFAGHPLSMAAGIATLRALRVAPPYARLERLTQRLADGLAKAAARHGGASSCNWAGSMVTVFFSGRPVRDAAAAQASDRARFAQWANALRAQGVLVPPSPFEALFLSTTHTEAHVERLVRASHAAWSKV